MNIRYLSAGAMALALAACSGGLSVTSDFDPNVNFANYKTFVVLDPAAGGADLGSFVQTRIKNSIAATLTAKGMRQVGSVEDAETAVGWQVTTQQRSSFSTVSTGWGGYPYGWGWGGWYGGGMGMATTTTTEQRYTVGALVIALFDVERKEMIYTATGTKELADDNPSPEESQQRIDEAVQQILKGYPPSSSTGS